MRKNQIHTIIDFLLDVSGGKAKNPENYFTLVESILRSESDKKFLIKEKRNGKIIIRRCDSQDQLKELCTEASGYKTKLDKLGGLTNNLLTQFHNKSRYLCMEGSEEQCNEFYVSPHSANCLGYFKAMETLSSTKDNLYDFVAAYTIMILKQKDNILNYRSMSVSDISFLKEKFAKEISEIFEDKKNLVALNKKFTTKIEKYSDVIHADLNKAFPFPFGKTTIKKPEDIKTWNQFCKFLALTIHTSMTEYPILCIRTLTPRLKKQEIKRKEKLEYA